MTLKYLVIAHVLGVPVVLQPMLWGVLLHKITHSVSEIIRFQQEQLDDEVAHLSFVSLMTAHSLQCNTYKGTAKHYRTESSITLR